MVPVVVAACLCMHSLISLRPLPAAQPKSPQQLIPAQENEDTKSEQREDEEEKDKQAVPERLVLIWGRGTQRRRVNTGRLPSGESEFSR